jgi:hypothetical protein
MLQAAIRCRAPWLANSRKVHDDDAIAVGHGGRQAPVSDGKRRLSGRPGGRPRNGVLVSDAPVDLDKHRGMAAQKATGLRRVLAEAEANALALRERQQQLEAEMLAAPAGSWPEAAAKARYVLNLYVAALGPQDSRHRDLVTAVLADFERLSHET